jgi:osmotically-inducible protein OsmY
MPKTSRRTSKTPSGVKVAAHDGDVTLSGKVRSWAERRDAERTVWLGRGVNSVTNHITVDSVV